MKKRLYAAIFAGLLLCGCANAADETFDDRYAASGDIVTPAATVETGSIAIPEPVPETEAVPETENTPETQPMVEPEQPVVVPETEPVAETEPVPVVVETEPVIETEPEPVVIETEPETTPIVETEPMPETTPETEPVPEPAPVVETEPAPVVVETEPAPEIPQEITYVLNTNTKKFHLPGCASVKKIKEKNYKAFTGTREEAIAQGYDPCKNCKP